MARLCGGWARARPAGPRVAVYWTSSSTDFDAKDADAKDAKAEGDPSSDAVGRGWAKGLVAPGGVDPPAVVAHTPVDVRGRWWVVRHGRVVGRRRNVRRNCVGEVRAATHRYPAARASTYVGIRDPGCANSDDRPRDAGERQNRRRREGP